MQEPVFILIAASAIMFAVIGGLSLLAHYYTLNGITLWHLLSRLARPMWILRLTSQTSPHEQRAFYITLAAERNRSKLELMKVIVISINCIKKWHTQLDAYCWKGRGMQRHNC